MEQQKQKLASEPNQNYRKKWNFKNLQTLRSPLLQLQKKKLKYTPKYYNMEQQNPRRTCFRTKSKSRKYGIYEHFQNSQSPLL